MLFKNIIYTILSMIGTQLSDLHVLLLLFLQQSKRKLLASSAQKGKVRVETIIFNSKTYAF